MSEARVSHEELEPLIAADALGGLGDEDRLALDRGLAQHGPDCVECRRMIAEYAGVAAAMALTLEPLPLAPGAEDRLMAAARGVRPVVAPAPAAPPSDELAVRRSRPRTAPSRVSRWVAAAAVAAAIAMGAGVAGYAIRGGGSPAAKQFVSFVAQPGTRVASFPAKDRQRLAVAYRPGHTEAWVVGANLDAPANGKVYELWYRPTGGSKMAPAGTFVPSDGSVVIPATVGSSFDTLAVTVEPGFQNQPTTQPIFVTTV